jgi:hypothetical protein
MRGRCLAAVGQGIRARTVEAWDYKHAQVATVGQAGVYHFLARYAHVEVGHFGLCTLTQEGGRASDSRWRCKWAGSERLGSQGRDRGCGAGRIERSGRRRDREKVGRGRCGGKRKGGESEFGAVLCVDGGSQQRLSNFPGERCKNLVLDSRRLSHPHRVE